MTIVIADNSPRISYVATAGQTVFTVPFEFFDDLDVNLYINDVLKVIETDYTVSGGDGSTGTLILVTGAALNDVIVLTRSIELERVTDFPTSGPFQVNSLNVELDKHIAMIADLQDLANRGLRLSDSDTTLSLTLASKDVRKGTVLAFNATTGAVEVGPTIADTNTVAQIKADISTVAGISGNVTTVAGISSDVTTVAGVSTDVTTVAGNTSNIQDVVDNLTDIQNAVVSASEAATSASNASASETAAASSASSAATSEANAGTSATSAATSASSASSSASTATTKASEASTSASNASTSATNAATSETNAATSETNAGLHATDANASASSAFSSASSAASSASSASSAQTAAEAARDSALAAFDNFDDKYLGEKASDPTVDNDGDALVSGALYFNTTDDAMKVYNGTSWVESYVDGTSFVAKAGDTMTGDLSLGDNNKAIFGAGSDLEIYHDGSNSYVRDVGTGNLNLQTNGARLSIHGTGSGSTKTMAAFVDGGTVQLSHNGNQKFNTTATGVDVTGTVTAGGLIIDNSNPNLLLKESDTSDLNTRLNSNFGSFRIASTNSAGSTYVQRFNVDHATGDISFYEDTGTTAKLTWDASDEALKFADNSFAMFGDGSDLRIYHDGSNSIIRESGVGNLYVQGTNLLLTDPAGNNFVRMIDNGTGGTVTLYHDNSAKLATTSTGIDVTGGITTSDNIIMTKTNGAVTIQDATNNNQRGQIQQIAGRLILRSRNDASNGNISFEGHNSQEYARFNSSGYLGIGTTSPDAQLDISSATTSTLRLSNTDTGLAENQITGQLEFYQADLSANPQGLGVTGKIRMRSVPNFGGGGYYGLTADMDFNVSGEAQGYASDNASLTAMTIQAGSGFVGIGTSSPTAALDVVGSVVSQVGINAQTGTTYTTVLADQSKLVTLTNASAITLTIPANSSVAYPVGTKIDFAQLGAGQVTVAGAGGVTVNATPTLKFRDQYSAASCIKTATDTWLLVGDLEA